MENRYGELNNVNCGFPASLSPTSISAVSSRTTNIKAGVGVNLTKWGGQYLKRFFGAGKINVTDLKKLSVNGKLYAEVVIHSSSTPASSGKVVYANVVDCEVGDETTCWFSPMFCFGDFKGLGLDFNINSGYEFSTLQTSSSLKPAKDPTYDYKTGEITNMPSSTLQTFGNLAKENIQITPYNEKCCRVRLFVESVEAAQTITQKLVDPEMAKRNKTLEYSGGKTETYVGNATTTGNLQLDIANTAKVLLNVYTQCGFVYSWKHSGVVSVESSKVETWVKEKLKAAGITHTTQNVVKIRMSDATSEEQARSWPTADCSSFVSSVLTSLGITSSNATAGEYNSGKPSNLINGYRLEKIDTPEMGCILSKPTHVGLAISATQQADFGVTNWMRNILEGDGNISHRLNWGGRENFVQGDGHKGTIRILGGYKPIGSSYTNYWRIVKN